MFSFCKICPSITLESWLDFVECKSPAGSIVCTLLAFGTKNNSDFHRHLAGFQDFGAKFLTFLGSKLGKYDMYRFLHLSQDFMKIASQLSSDLMQHLNLAHISSYYRYISL